MTYKRKLKDIVALNEEIVSKINIPKTIRVTKMPARNKYSQRAIVFIKGFTIDALEHCKRAGKRAVVLNFCNNTLPCGYYHHGSKAQEEDLCRIMPQLYQSLMRSKYPFNKQTTVLYSPNIKVMRNKKLNLVKNPYTVDIISASAPDLRTELFYERKVKHIIKLLFTVPWTRNKELNTIVLGAWGCGVFQNNPKR